MANLSEIFSSPKSQLGLMTLGNMLMQVNPQTQRVGNAMMQGGGALVKLQMEQEEREAETKAKNEQSLKETMFKLAASDVNDPAMFKLALEEHGVDPASPRAKTWIQYATSEEAKQRKQAMALFGESGGALFDQTKMSLKDMLDVMGEKRQQKKFDQDERHHAENLATSQGHLSVSQQRLALEQQEAQREEELANTLSALFEGGEPSTLQGQPASAPSGPEGGQVVPVGEGTPPFNPSESYDPTMQSNPQFRAEGQTSTGGWTGLPLVDKALRAGFMMAAKGDTGRANAFISGARVLADKSPEGRRAEIQQKIDEVVQTDLARLVPMDELAKYTKDGKPLPPGTTMADLTGPGSIELRPNQPMPPATQEKMMGALHALEFGKTIQEAVQKGVKTGPIKGPISWAKVWLGAENETKYNEAKKQLALAGQAIIPGIPSNYDMQTYVGTIPGWVDPAPMVQEKLRWNDKLSKQMIRTTLSYFQGSATIIPEELRAVAASKGIDLDTIGKPEEEEKKMKELDTNAKARLQKLGGTGSFSLDTDLSTLSPGQREAYSNWLTEQGY